MRWRMEIDPEAAKNSQWELIPEGDYLLKVDNVRDGTTKKGQPKVELRCKVVDGQENWGSVFLTITKIPKNEPGHGIMIHYLHVLGVANGDSLNFETCDLEGRTFTAKIGIEEYNGRKINKILKVFFQKHEESLREKTTEESDKVPF